MKEDKIGPWDWTLEQLHHYKGRLLALEEFLEVTEWEFENNHIGIAEPTTSKVKEKVSDGLKDSPEKFDRAEEAVRDGFREATKVLDLLGERLGYEGAQSAVEDVMGSTGATSRLDTLIGKYVLYEGPWMP
jgi:hypothetical protein